MKHEKNTKFQEQIKTISVVVSLILTLGGVVIGLFNYYTLNKLQPVYSFIKEVKAENNQIKDDFMEYKLTQNALFEKLATKEQLTALTNTLNNVSYRVDRVIEILIKK